MMTIDELEKLFRDDLTFILDGMLINIKNRINGFANNALIAKHPMRAVYETESLFKIGELIAELQNTYFYMPEESSTFERLKKIGEELDYRISKGG